MPAGKSVVSSEITEPAESHLTPADQASAERLFSPLRMVGYAAILTALAFVQASGRMVADTKFDLFTDPWGFIQRGLQLWDGNQAFGQLPNQQYGYVWPMGPFFGVGHWLQVPEWAVQRAWWALLLCLGFFGMLQLLRSLRIGAPLAQLVAAFAFVLTPRMVTLLGVASIELWPMALAPWVLLPLVRGTRTGSPFRAAGLSALVIACCGGVNAVAVAATLPLGMIWLLTRERGPRRTRLLLWWPTLTLFTTLWWSAPLLLMGQYSAPFLDYIENASVTTMPTDLTRTLVGTNDWMGYLGGSTSSSGWYLISTPYVLVQFIAVAALGLYGLCLRTNPHRRWLLLGLLVGLVLVGLGHTGPLDGFGAQYRQDLLDGVLAPLRNVHKFDVVLRIPLIIGLAWTLTVVPQRLRRDVSQRAAQAVNAIVIVMLVVMALPWLRDGIAAANGTEDVPEYWSEAARHLAATDDGGVTLELPATAFGNYAWGNTNDDIMQGLARSRWAVRNVVPLAEPGNVVMLDAVTKAVESGRTSKTLARFLASQGVSRVLVRNDLDLWRTGAPSPNRLRSVLDNSPGFRKAKAFGPVAGDAGWRIAEDGTTRVITADGTDTAVPALQVYDIEDTVRLATADIAAEVLVGDPGTLLDAALADRVGEATLLPEDAAALPETAGGLVTGQILTDGNRRREKSFPLVRRNEAATLARGEMYSLSGKEHQHRISVDQERWQSTAAWTGDVTGVAASSSQSQVTAPAITPAAHAGAALDQDRATAWLTDSDTTVDGQWWRADFDAPRYVRSVTVRIPVGVLPARTLTLDSGFESVTAPAPQPGQSRTYQLGWRGASALTLTLHGDDATVGSTGISEIEIKGVQTRRVIDLPKPVEGLAITTVGLQRDQGAASCLDVQGALSCDPWAGTEGEDGDSLNRRFTVGTGGTFRLDAQASLRPGVARADELMDRSGVEITAPGSPALSLAQSTLALVDGEESTTWRATGADNSFTVRLDEPVTLDQVQLVVGFNAPASAASRIRVTSGKRSAEVAVDSAGVAELPGWRTTEFSVEIVEVTPAFSAQGEFDQLPAGVSELKINGEPLVAPSARRLVLDCGEGPDLRVGDTTVRTGLDAAWSDMVRGTVVPLRVCGDGDVQLSDEVEVTVAPTTLVRPETLTFLAPEQATSVRTETPLVSDVLGSPVRTEVDTGASAELLTLAQNVNAGWRATVDGRELTPVRVDGWKQAWVVPAGTRGVVHFDYTPQKSFDPVLLVGAVLLMLFVIALVTSWAQSRRRPADHGPALAPSRPAALDVVVLVAAVATLAGWWGMAAAVVALAAVILVGRLTGAHELWASLAAVALVVAGLGDAFAPLESLGDEWRQGWALLALVGVAAALWSSVLDRDVVWADDEALLAPEGGESGPETPRESTFGDDQSDLATPERDRTTPGESLPVTE